MATWRWLFAFVFLFSLTACGPAYKITYDYQQPTTERGQQCVTQCQKSKSICQTACTRKHNLCVSEARATARQKFHDYQQTSQASDEKKTIDDFYDDSTCNAQICDCVPDYNACFQMCDGVLIPHRAASGE